RLPGEALSRERSGEASQPRRSVFAFAARPEFPKAGYVANPDRRHAALMARCNESDFGSKKRRRSAQIDRGNRLLPADCGGRNILRVRSSDTRRFLTFFPP